MKAKRAVKHIFFDRPEANPGEMLYVSVQKLKDNEVIMPGALLCYRLSGHLARVGNDPQQERERERMCPGECGKLAQDDLEQRISNLKERKFPHL